MRIFDDKQVKNELLRMLKDGEELKCGVFANIVPTFKQRLLNQFLLAGIESNSTYCIFEIGGRKLLFSILDSKAYRVAKITVDFNDIIEVKIRKGLFGQYIIYMKDIDNELIKVNVPGVAWASEITKQREMREILIREITNEFIEKK